MVVALSSVRSAEDDDMWKRAYVLSVSDAGFYRVSYCDFGYTETVRVVKKLPQDLASIPEFAARCSVISSTKSMEELWSSVSRNS
jgi:hypothetical protein